MPSNDEKLDKAIQCIKEGFKKETDPRRMQKTANSIANQIRRRTLLGFGITKQFDGEQERLKKLTSKAYRGLRKRKSSLLSKKTTPGRSNLTATGQLLKAIKGIGRRARAIIELKDKRSGKTISGADDDSTNSDILKWQKAQGREFFGLTASEKKRFERAGASRITKEAKKCFDQ